MIPINPNEWKEISKDEVRMQKSKNSGENAPLIEFFDGLNWRFYIK